MDDSILLSVESNLIMNGVIMLNVVMLIVMAPCGYVKGNRCFIKISLKLS
jgi:hypothetical protein